MRLPGAAAVLRVGLPHLRFGPVQMVLVVAGVLLGLFLYSLFQTAQSNYHLQAEVDSTRQRVYELEVQQAELDGLKAYLATDEYIEGVARQQFGLVKPGEVAVVVDAGGFSQPPRRPGERWWEALFGR